MIVSNKFINEVSFQYNEINKENSKDSNRKTVAFYDRAKVIPAEHDGLQDTVFLCKEDCVINEKEYKKGDKVYELYVRIENSKDKYSIYDQKVKNVLVKGRGYMNQTEIYRQAYEKYLNFKKNSCKSEDELKYEKLLTISEAKDEELKNLKAKLANNQAGKSKETVGAFSDTKDKVEGNDTVNNKPKHR